MADRTGAGTRTTWFCYECRSSFDQPVRNAGNDLPLCPTCASDVVEERDPQDTESSAFISDYSAAAEEDDPAEQQIEDDARHAALLQGMFGPPPMFREPGSRQRQGQEQGQARQGQGQGGLGQGQGGEGFGGLMDLMGGLFGAGAQAGPGPGTQQRNSNGGGGGSGNNGGPSVRTFTFGGGPGSTFGGGGATISFGGANVLQRGSDGRVHRSDSPAAGRGQTLGGGPGRRDDDIPNDDEDPEWEDVNPFAQHGMPPPFFFPGGPTGGNNGARGVAGAGGNPFTGQPQVGNPFTFQFGHVPGVHGQGQGQQATLEDMIMGLLGGVHGQGGEGVPPFFMGGMGPGGEGAGIRGNLGDYVFSQEGLDQVLERMMEAAGSSNAPPPASEVVINGLPRLKLDDKALEESQYKDCSVCQDEFKIGEEVVRIPCKHIFHTDCVVPWLKVNGTCPVCRFSLVPEGERAQARQDRNEGQQLPDLPANPLQAVFQGIQNLFGGAAAADERHNETRNAGVPAQQPQPGASTTGAVPTGQTGSSSSGSQAEASQGAGAGAAGVPLSREPSTSNMPGAFPSSSSTSQDQDQARPPAPPLGTPGSSFFRAGQTATPPPVPTIPFASSSSSSSTPSATQSPPARPAAINPFASFLGGGSTPNSGPRSPHSVGISPSANPAAFPFGFGRPPPQQRTQSSSSATSQSRSQSSGQVPEPYPSMIPREHRERHAKREAEMRAEQEGGQSQSQSQGQGQGGTSSSTNGLNGDQPQQWMDQENMEVD